ncbi:MAG TPA: C40 family peptidase [Mycobacterium sp.]|nr:C40 family peptidase [Mycobacterium sp.]
MASALVTSLAAPLRELQAAVGTGVFTGDDPAVMLRDASRVLTDVAASAASTAGQMGAAWSGAAADVATQAITTAFTTASELATHALGMANRVGAASEAVARAKARLQRIIEDFETTSRSLEPGLPATAGAIADAARRALEDATLVVGELESELDGHASAVSQQPTAGAAPMTAPMTSPAGLMSSMPASGLPSGMLGAAPGLASLANEALADPDAFGSGEAVRLPDGSMVTAPNSVAAEAVRRALSQLGVPYDWGGEAPGAGFDCSGLTQWAYHEAGLNLPRTADQQDVGAAVSANALLPGDLAVWDGHVAMVVGNGTMIEAGDPVKLSPIRTTNAGQGFQGFWRPTA